MIDAASALASADAGAAPGVLEPEHDCGHRCCDERSNPHHDHFLSSSDCPSCAAPGVEPGHEDAVTP